MEKEKKEVKKTNKNKIVIIISLIILLFAILFIYWYFNRKFDVVFDYKLRTGRAMTRNAIRLLAMIGYDPKIIEAAQESAKHFEETGVWK